MRASEQHVPPRPPAGASRALVWSFGLVCALAGAALTEIGDHIAAGGPRFWWTVAKTVGSASMALWLGRLLRTELGRPEPHASVEPPRGHTA